MSPLNPRPFPQAGSVHFGGCFLNLGLQVLGHVLHVRWVVNENHENQYFPNLIRGSAPLIIGLKNINNHNPGCWGLTQIWISAKNYLKNENTRRSFMNGCLCFMLYVVFPRCKFFCMHISHTHVNILYI